MEPVTIDSLLDDVRTRVEAGVPIGTHEYLDVASKLIALSQELDEELVRAEMEVNRARAKLIMDGSAAASAKELVKSTEGYERWQLLLAKKERVYAQVQIAKKRTEAIV